MTPAGGSGLAEPLEAAADGRASALEERRGRRRAGHVSSSAAAAAMSAAGGARGGTGGRGIKGWKSSLMGTSSLLGKTAASIISVGSAELALATLSMPNSAATLRFT